MIRGTTPTHTFKLPIDANIIKEVMIIYAQNDVQVLCKKTSDCDLSDKQVSVSLTQEDTFLFDHKHSVQIQMRILTDAGDALVSDITVVSVRKCLNNEVLQ